MSTPLAVLSGKWTCFGPRAGASGGLELVTYFPSFPAFSSPVNPSFPLPTLVDSCETHTFI